MSRANLPARWKFRCWTSPIRCTINPVGDHMTWIGKTKSPVARNLCFVQCDEACCRTNQTLFRCEQVNRLFKSARFQVIGTECSALLIEERNGITNGGSPDAQRRVNKWILRVGDIDRLQNLFEGILQLR